jgi:hypothetical protein
MMGTMVDASVPKLSVNSVRLFGFSVTRLLCGILVQRPACLRLPIQSWKAFAAFAANVLRSPRATEMALYVVRAFVRQREALATNATILRRLAEIDRTLLEHDSALRILWRKLQPLLATPPEKLRRRIGFHPDDSG